MGLGSEGKAAQTRPGAYILLLLAAITMGPPASKAQDPPPNDSCEAATPIAFGTFEGSTQFSTPDGSSACEPEGGVGDLWYELTFSEAREVFIDTPSLGTGYVLSLHSQCPGTSENEIACGETFPVYDASINLSFQAEADQSYYLRVSAKGFDDLPGQGPYRFRVGPGGEIHGTVTDVEGSPIPGIVVGVSSPAQTVTDDEGRYFLRGLSTRDYTVFAANNTPYVAELWNNVHCPQLSSCDFGAPTPVPVEIDGITENIDFVLELGAAITGSVRDDTTGQALEEFPITLVDLVSNLQLVNLTDSNGEYRFEGLGAGSYVIFSELSEVYRSEIWDDQSCGFSDCNPLEGAPIVMDLGETATGIDFALDRGTSIEGRVVDESTQQPVAFERIHLLDLEGIFQDLAFTDEDGRFTFMRLDPGSYLMRTATRTHLDEIWPDLACPFDQCPPADQATPITVDLEQPAAAIDFALRRGGVIRGAVADASSGEAVGDGVVGLYDPAGNLLAAARAQGNNDYELAGLIDGEYRLVGYDTDGDYAPEVYDGISCDGLAETCDPSLGTPIEILEGQVLTVDFALERNPGFCETDFETLCLNQDRFSVRARWRTADGASGPAFPTAITGSEDSGTFWFFEPANIELVVKVLDACTDPWQRFWVFAAGLTNVEVEITVIDNWTHEEKVYFNPGGARFQPIQDTQAFATCDGPTSGARPGAPEAVLEDLNAMFEGPENHPAESNRVTRQPSSLDKSGSCLPSDTVLCLGDGGRFRVEATWRSPAGATGDARAVAFETDTGMFWFFGADNIELVVKILEACVDPWQSFWVFAGGLTDVEVTLKVTDTQTGVENLYSNPLGSRFAPIQDIQAFSCP